MITVDTSAMRKYTRALKAVSSRGVDYAMRNTLNDVAYKGMRIGRKEVQERFTIRTPWTIRSIGFRRAITLVKPESAVGSTEEYMRTQEEGGARRPTSGAKNVPVPTGYAYNEEGTTDHKKLPLRSRRMRNIQLTKNGGSSRRARNQAAIAAAISSANKFAYMDTPKMKGIFHVKGGKKTRRLKLVHDLRHKSVNIPKREWLRPTADKALDYAPRYYYRNMLRQIDRALKIS